jgi:hypothetical protein
MKLALPKITRIRVYTGIAINQTVVTGVDVVKDKVEMELAPGVYLTPRFPFKRKLIPFANILEIDLADEEVDAQVRKMSNL